jgi:hypothetical protein
VRDVIRDGERICIASVMALVAAEAVKVKMNTDQGVRFRLADRPA